MILSLQTVIKAACIIGHISLTHVEHICVWLLIAAKFLIEDDFFKKIWTVTFRCKTTTILKAISMYGEVGEGTGKIY
jgi:hypothetical protein